MEGGLDASIEKGVYTTIVIIVLYILNPLTHTNIHRNDKPQLEKEKSRLLLRRR